MYMYIQSIERGRKHSHIYIHFLHCSANALREPTRHTPVQEARKRLSFGSRKSTALLFLAGNFLGIVQGDPRQKGVSFVVFSASL